MEILVRTLKLLRIMGLQMENGRWPYSQILRFVLAIFMTTFNIIPLVSEKN